MTRERCDAALSRVTDGWLQLAALADAGIPREPYFPSSASVPSRSIVSESLAKTIAADPVAWFTAERLGLHATIGRCCAEGRHQAAALLASFMASFQHRQGRPDDTEQVWRMIAAAAHEARDSAANARAELRLAVAICGQGRHAEASPTVDQCTRTFHERADKHGLATALYWRAVCDWNLGAYADARQSADRAMDLARDTGDLQTEILALRIRAIALANLPDQQKNAVKSAEQALALASDIGHATLEHEVLHSVASVYNLAGRHADALRLSEDGLALGRGLGVQELADWLGLLGDAYHGLGRYGEAAESLRSALPYYRDHFMRRHHALCLLKMGYAYQAMGEHQTAISHLKESLAIFGQLRLDHYAERARATIADSWSLSMPAVSRII